MLGPLPPSPPDAPPRDTDAPMWDGMQPTPACPHVEAPACAPAATAPTAGMEPRGPDQDAPLARPEEYAWMVAGLADIRWPWGASATPPQVVAECASHVNPVAILCARPDHLLGNAWGDSLQSVTLLADRSGIERAAQGVCGDHQGSLPVILTVDLGGAAMQNLIHSIWMSGKDARILGLASRRVPGTLRTSGLQLPFLAHAQWGARALYYATFLSAVGEPLRTGRGSQTAQVLAAQFRIRAVRIRTIDPPQCTCAWGALAG